MAGFISKIFERFKRKRATARGESTATDYSSASSADGAATAPSATPAGGSSTGVAPLTGLDPTGLLYQKRESHPLPFQKYYPYLAVGVGALMAADLTTTYSRGEMIPKAAPPAKRLELENRGMRLFSEYSGIFDRNIFNSDGLIPESLVADGQAGPADTKGPAHESTLPITLVGTIVHADPGKSVASIEIKGQGAEKMLPYIPNDDVGGVATLLKVERKKAFIRNLSSGALEFIQIKDESSFSFGKKSNAGAAKTPVQAEGDTFAMSREELKGQMANLPDLLTQARAVPNFVPGGNGKINGFRIVDIQEGSLFAKLGIQQDDVIDCVDGEPLDSAAKAMEFYNALSNKNKVELCVNRKGQKKTLTYNIR